LPEKGKNDSLLFCHLIHIKTVIPQTETIPFFPMNTENKVLMKQARESLEGKWGLAIGTFIVYLILSAVLQLVPKVGPVVSIFISGPFALGITIFSLNLARNREAKIEQIFDGFKNFGTALGAYLLVFVFTLLWLLLLVIPGIIAALSYSQTMYIIADNPSIGAMEAINRSKAMMEGHKMRLFILGLMFFGLGILCILTLGIGFLWLYPFATVTLAKFYEDINPENKKEIGSFSEGGLIDEV